MTPIAMANISSWVRTNVGVLTIVGASIGGLVTGAWTMGHAMGSWTAPAGVAAVNAEVQALKAQVERLDGAATGDEATGDEVGALRAQVDRLETALEEAATGDEVGALRAQVDRLETALETALEEAATGDEVDAPREKSLDMEIALRVYRARRYLARLGASAGANALNVKGVLRNMGPVSDQPYPMGVFSEFRDETLSSLLSELANVVSRQEQEAIFDALDSSIRLDNIEGEITNGLRDKKCAFIARIYKELDDNFSLSRWEQISGFREERQSDVAECVS